MTQKAMGSAKNSRQYGNTWDPQDGCTKAMGSKGIYSGKMDNRAMRMVFKSCCLGQGEQWTALIIGLQGPQGHLFLCL